MARTGLRNAPKSVARRTFLQLGAAGLTLPELLLCRRQAAAVAPTATNDRPTEPPRSGSRSVGRAKSCIVLFAWGGMSHVDTWDMKPEGSSDIRGEFEPIATSVPGLDVSEHLPRLARQTQHLAVVRSVCHQAADHREAAYWNLTGHEPRLLSVPPVMPSRADWPSLGAQIAHAQARAQRSASLPRTISLPYPIADRGLLNGQYGGFLGPQFDPVFLQPPTGTPYRGVSQFSGNIDLNFAAGVDETRLSARRELLAQLDRRSPRTALQKPAEAIERSRTEALEMLLAPEVRAAFDLRRESAATHEAYGNHICSQSTLLARRLSEAGVPLVTVFCSAGDLNGSSGDNWDTHGNNFNRLKNDLLPPYDRAAATLIADLAERGRLDDTLVVLLTEFGRSPRINTAAGRDHYPNCYSVAFAGGGIRGGQVYGRSDAQGARPLESSCGPEDLHATIFAALGIDRHFAIHDLERRPFPLTSGKALPLFG